MLGANEQTTQREQHQQVAFKMANSEGPECPESEHRNAHPNNDAK